MLTNYLIKDVPDLGLSFSSIFLALLIVVARPSLPNDGR